MMETTTGKRARNALVVSWLLGALGAVAALAFVPSAEEELARAYPPALKGDLGACSDPAARVAPDTQADLAKFASRLNGTWRLRSRTHQGISVDVKGRASGLYFDLEPAEGNRVTGAALLVDRPQNGTALAADAVAGFWGLVLTRNDAGRIAVRLSGEAVGSYANVRAAGRQEHEFFELDGVFASVFKAAAPAPVWDRIVIADNSLTYVACADGVVERYVKISSHEPRIEGASLEEYWQKLQGERKVAWAF